MGVPRGRYRTAGPDPSRIATRADLARELNLLRGRAAAGTLNVRVSLTDLAERVDVPRSTVHAYLSGKHLPPAEVLDRIVIALGATAHEQRLWSEAWFRVCTPPTSGATSTMAVAVELATVLVGADPDAAASRLAQHLARELRKLLAD
ncbi:helix-turn-helix domain-containing protein [Tenggerimyces flavus]|uniref:Helix-turn-helix domain-containing protein n=1 Tax=Tenggerimyces flavus TaxID=1708749 RepID=A0ABV7YL93_9ACTN|nr:helix-turn-helix transcriptional regulator [Tenggerimyces flavus]MBM7789357.1 transcriptional regulator with XRE-family HTH domain [Tenggerimyces flavus]